MFESYVLALAFGFAGLLMGLASLWRQAKFDKRIDRLFAGLDHDGSIETTLERYFAQVKTTDDKLTTLQRNYHHLSKIAAASLQKTAIVRFNPFKHTGGDQSFALAFLDNHDNGFVLTSIHSREGTRVYVKPISYGTSDHTLSKEEQSALQAAVTTKEVKDN